MNNKLSTFVFVRNDGIISPVLTTVREYARWLETAFDEYTCNYELYLKAKIGSDKVLEFHPGTRIGQYFDNGSWNEKYHSWYVYQDSIIMNKLNKMKFAEYKDIAPVRCNNSSKRLLRLYSVDQINLYVKTKIDRNFNINRYLGEPKKIVVRKCDMDKLIIPKIKSVKKSLLSSQENIVAMTVSDIEKLLGHKVSIIS